MTPALNKKARAGSLNSSLSKDSSHSHHESTLTHAQSKMSKGRKKSKSSKPGSSVVKKRKYNQIAEQELKGY